MPAAAVHSVSTQTSGQRSREWWLGPSLGVIVGLRGLHSSAKRIGARCLAFDHDQRHVCCSLHDPFVALSRHRPGCCSSFPALRVHAGAGQTTRLPSGVPKSYEDCRDVGADSSCWRRCFMLTRSEYADLRICGFEHQCLRCWP